MEEAEKEIVEALRRAYQVRANINYEISALENRLRKISPTYRRTMEAIQK